MKYTHTHCRLAINNHGSAGREMKSKKSWGVSQTHNSCNPLHTLRSARLFLLPLFLVALVACNSGGGGGNNSPSAPRNLKAIAGDKQVALSWSAFSGATRYKVYYYTSSFDKASDATLWSTKPDTSVTVTGLDEGRQYFFRVSAVTASGESALSKEATATTLYAKVQVAPGKLVFSWEKVADAQFYKLLLNEGDGGGFVPLAENIDATSYDLTIDVHLLDWANVRYRVEACNNTTCNSPFKELLLSLARSKDAITYIKASNTGADDNFGISVSLSGNTLAVGASRESSSSTRVGGDEADNSADYSGAVYVFSRNDSGVWTQDAYIKPSNTGAGDYFGSSVSLSGNTLAVGAYLEDSNSTGVDGNEADDNAKDSGAVYVFSRNDSGDWTQDAYIKASNTDMEDYFGYSVSLSGNILAVGANQEDSNSTGVGGDETDDSVSRAGAVYVFSRNDSGDWTQDAYIKASNTGKFTEFGYSVSLSDNTLVVGSPGEYGSSTGIDGDETRIEDFIFSGAVYVFSRNDSGDWTQDAYIKASNTDAYDNFGHSVSLSDNTLAVGANWESSSSTGVDGNEADDDTKNSGAVYVFSRNDSGDWTQDAYIKASNTDMEDYFGKSVSLSGNTLAVGAYEEDSNSTGVGGDETDNSAGGSGAVYVFSRNDSGDWTQDAYIKASNTDASDQFGRSFSLSGNSLAVGAVTEGSSSKGIGGNQEDNSADNSGALYIY